MLPSVPEDGLDPYVFRLDILVAKGEKLVLALLYLGFLYVDESVAKVVQPVGDATSSPPSIRASYKCSCTSNFLWWVGGSGIP